ncbi:hypothetical protein AGMMS4956_17640 [Bacteroidia bacterium]|nr:hypothetical protein AGMMS4956_17640 [Bacteroidia bacterium]
MRLLFDLLLNLVYTVGFIIYILIIAPFHVLFAATLLLFTFPFDKKRKLQHYYSVFISNSWFTISFFLRTKIKGLENVDKHQTYIIISNHQSMLDILWLYKVPTVFKWVSKWEAYRIPFVGALLWLREDVCVKRGDAVSVRKMMTDCSHWLKNKVSIIMFPEGTRSKTGRIGQFKEGAFILAKKNNVPILPVVIEGTRDYSMYNKWYLFNARQVVQLTVLPPIAAHEVAQTGIRDMMERLHSQMLTEHQGMVPHKYAKNETQPRD